ncbi:MAG: PD40 domain-containing protein [Thermoleophilaceae bacterium]|nr:PD40 domain-containing protein [Thermoleophilaceae bacterium]
MTFANSASAAVDDLDLVSWPAEFLPIELKYAGASHPSISGTGRFVAFTSYYGLPFSTELYSDVFVRDMVTGTTELVSSTDGANGNPGNGDAWDPWITPDGRFVVFASVSDDLTADAVGYGSSIFIRDRLTNDTSLVEASDDDLIQPSVSSSGRLVAYAKRVGNSMGGVFVRDRQTSQTVMASRATGEFGTAPYSNQAATPVISSDGTAVAFCSMALDDIDAQGIFSRNLQTYATTRISRESGASGAAIPVNCEQPGVSSSARYVAFSSRPSAFGNSSLRDQILLRDTQLNTTTTVSRATGISGALGDDDSSFPTVSADGNLIAFHSRSNNLTAENVGTTRTNIFVRDVSAASTKLVSRASGSAGILGDDDDRSEYPSVSSDGKYVAFNSNAESFSSEDGNNDYVDDVFRRDVGGGSINSYNGPTPPGSHRSIPAPYVPGGPASGGGAWTPPKYATPLKSFNLLIRIRKSMRVKGVAKMSVSWKLDACTLKTTATLYVRAKAVPGAITKEKSSGKSSAFTFKLSKSARRAAAKALAAGQRVRVHVDLVGSCGSTYRDRRYEKYIDVQR